MEGGSIHLYFGFGEGDRGGSYVRLFGFEFREPFTRCLSVGAGGGERVELLEERAFNKHPRELINEGGRLALQLLAEVEPDEYRGVRGVEVFGLDKFVLQAVEMTRDIEQRRNLRFPEPIHRGELGRQRVLAGAEVGLFGARHNLLGEICQGAVVERSEEPVSGFTILTFSERQVRAQVIA